MMPNLHTLVFPVPFEADVLLATFHTLASSMSGARVFKLRELGLRYLDTVDAVDMQELEGLLVPPNLETFCGFAVDWCDPHTTTWPLGFKHISLRASLIDGPGLSSLLSRCEKFRTLLIA